MDYRGNGRNWQDVATYSPDQVEYVLNEIGLEVESETESAFLCFCPYHGNKYTPSFAVSSTEGMFICFNQSCAETGSLKDLIKYMTKRDEYRALRLIAQAKLDSRVSVSDRIKKIMDRSELKEFSSYVIDKCYENFWKYPDGLEYMTGRGFSENILRRYRIGYSPYRPADDKWPEQQPRVTVPMYDIDGKPIGMIGRFIEEKAFKNSKGLPKNRTLYNIHRAKRAGDTVIINEASFDTMKVDQAGYPCAVSVLGGSFSDYHAEQLNKYFNTIILMTDYDDKKSHRQANCKKCKTVALTDCSGHNPGRALAEKIAETMKHKRIRWAITDSGVVYPDGHKDATDLNSAQIKTMIKGSVSNYEYHKMGFDLR